MNIKVGSIILGRGLLGDFLAVMANVFLVVFFWAFLAFVLLDAEDSVWTEGIAVVAVSLFVVLSLICESSSVLLSCTSVSVVRTVEGIEEAL